MTQSMTQEKTIEILEDLWRYEKVKYTDQEVREAIEMAIKMSSRLCDDAVSRSELVQNINAMMSFRPYSDVWLRKWANENRQYLNVLECVEKLTPVIPERNRAKWIDKYKNGDWHCSACGAIVEKDEQARHWWNCCYHCGSLMEREGET